MNWRTLLVVLAVLNIGFYAWAQGWLAPFDFAPEKQHEPERVSGQLRPEAIRIGNVTGNHIGGAQQYLCLRTGLITEDALPAVRLAAENALPEGIWRIESLNLQERWIVYMGKYPNRQTVQRKQRELQRLGVTELLPLPERLQPGLSLAATASRERAEAALSALKARGVRTARVMQQQEGIRGSYIQLDRVSPSMKLQLEALRPALQGVEWQLCG